jgi:hypothetical protein
MLGLPRDLGLPSIEREGLEADSGEVERMREVRNRRRLPTTWWSTASPSGISWLAAPSP